jgi:tripartite-type tricarboxylate transporter receptor subunit TctC
MWYVRKREFAASCGRNVHGGGGPEVGASTLRGENEAVRDLLSGVVPSFFGTTSNLIAQHEAGSLRILALSSKERIDALKEIPTFAELGLKPVVYTWFHNNGWAK